MRCRVRQRAATVLAVFVLLATGLLSGPAAAQTAHPENGQLGASVSEKLSHAPKNTARSLQAIEPPVVTADCPPTIRCIVSPAAFQAIDGNVADYGNYDLANRPRDMKITHVVIHDGEGSCQDIVDAFKNPRHYAATPYVVCKDGTVHQMVRNQDLPWHAGNWYFNMHSIGIEHEGHAATGNVDYTPAMYWASAQLVKHLTAKYSIPRDREHIIGHDNIPAVKNSQVAGMHTDPGPYWDWQQYMALIGAPVLPSGGFDSKFVTVAPTWPLSKQVVTGCSVGNNGCAPQGAQPVNFVYVRTEPRSDAPFFTDSILGQGSTDITNNAARLFHGQTFAVADKQLKADGVWYKVWLNGKTGWFFSPWGAPTALPASGKYVSPKSDKTSIPVYGRPVPELSAYPAELLNTEPGSFWIPTLAPQAPLSYTVLAGQRFKMADVNAINDHFYAWNIDHSLPFEGKAFKGQTKFIGIQYGKQLGYVKAEDVDIK